MDFKTLATHLTTVGLHPQLNNTERKLFRGRENAYRTLRDKIVSLACQDLTLHLDLDTVLAALEPLAASLIPLARETYHYLDLYGCINFGCLKNGPALYQAPPLPALPPEPTLPPFPTRTQEDLALSELLWLTHQELAIADLSTVSSKAIRKRLEEKLSFPLTDEQKGAVNTYCLDFVEADGNVHPPTPPFLAAYDEAIKARRAVMQAIASQLQKRVIVIGAGAAGLAATLHLARHGVDVLCLEARDRVGGRVYSYQQDGFSVPVDLGASLITGIAADVERHARPDPSALLANQLGIQLHLLASKDDGCPLLDAEEGGRVLDGQVDQKVAHIHESLLTLLREEYTQGDEATREALEAESLGSGMKRWLETRQSEVLHHAHVAMEKHARELMVKRKREQEEEDRRAKLGGGGGGGEEEAAAAVALIAPSLNGPPISSSQQQQQQQREQQQEDQPQPPTLPPPASPPPPHPPLSTLEQRAIHWHAAHLEYGCSAPLSLVSLPHWDDDEIFSAGFGGPHAMVVGGYGSILNGLAAQLTTSHLRLNCPVASIQWNEQGTGVTVTTRSGEAIEAGNVIVTLPLGVLQAASVTFHPPLPPWKLDAITSHGFGDLNKVIFQFESSFWTDSVDFFGILSSTLDDEATRGLGFLCWNVERFAACPVLTCLVSGQAALAAEKQDDAYLTRTLLAQLARVFPASVPLPAVRAHVITRWKSDPYTLGSYSFIPVKSSASVYDRMMLPLSPSVFFAGEHTIKEYPDTVGGALLTGVREAIRWIEFSTKKKMERVMDVPPGVIPQAERGKAVKRRAKRTEEEKDEARAALERLAASYGGDQEEEEEEEDEEEEEAKRKRRKERKERKRQRLVLNVEGGDEQGGDDDDDEEEEAAEEGRPRKRRGGGGDEDPGERGFAQPHHVEDKEAIMLIVQACHALSSRRDAAPLVALMEQYTSETDGRRSSVMFHLATSKSLAKESLPSLATHGPFVSLLASWLEDILSMQSDGYIADLQSHFDVIKSLSMPEAIFLASPLFPIVTACRSSVNKAYRERAERFLSSVYPAIIERERRRTGLSGSGGGGGGGGGGVAKKVAIEVEDQAAKEAKEREAHVRARLEQIQRDMAALESKRHGELGASDNGTTTTMMTAKRRGMGLSGSQSLVPVKEEKLDILRFSDRVEADKVDKQLATKKKKNGGSGGSGGGGRPGQHKPLVVFGPGGAVVAAPQPPPSQPSQQQQQGGGGGDVELPQELKTLLREYIEEKLYPHYKSGKLNKEQFSHTVKKAVHAIGKKEASGFVPGMNKETFLTEQRKDKIKKFLFTLTK